MVWFSTMRAVIVLAASLATMRGDSKYSHSGVSRSMTPSSTRLRNRYELTTLLSEAPWNSECS